VDWTADGSVRESASGNPPASADADPAQAGDRLERPRREASPRRRTRARTVQLPRQASAPPEDAVHTLAPEDPRPALRPLRIDPDLIRTVGPGMPDAEQIVLTVAEPTEIWSADADVSDHYLRGDLVIQVRRADNTVIGAFTAGYALAVRPEAVRPDTTGRSVRGGRGTRHPTTRAELLDRLHEAGFVIRTGSTHGRITHPDHPGLFVPLASTPSDVRFTRHAVTQVRRVFGIDLRR
jgi:hypothetical protein